MKDPCVRGQKSWRSPGVLIGLGVCLLELLALLSLVQAQHEVTLSGFVTDGDGQPVQGAFVFLQEMPGFVFVEGFTTLTDGSYQLSVPPGTYRLTVDRKRGPFIPQVIESFTLTGNTTHDFVLAKGFTLSGRVTDASGAPVAQAFVDAIDENCRQVSVGNTDEAGQYSFGAPPGTYTVRVFTQGRFVDKQIENMLLDHDLMLDITLSLACSSRGRWWTKVVSRSRAFRSAPMTQRWGAALSSTTPRRAMGSSNLTSPRRST